MRMFIKAMVESVVGMFFEVALFIIGINYIGEALGSSMGLNNVSGKGLLNSGEIMSNIISLLN